MGRPVRDLDWGGMLPSEPFVNCSMVVILEIELTDRLVNLSEHKPREII